VNIYEANIHFSKVFEKAEKDLKPQMPKKNHIKFGVAVGKFQYKDKELVGIDPDIQEMFYDETEI
jgi:hypothetical protein